MQIERLSTDNLREGVFCRNGKPRSEKSYTELEAWLEGNKLRGQIARADDGSVAGFVLYYPIEHAPMDIEGKGLYMVQCIHVLPEYQQQGIGRALIESAMRDAKAEGASGLAAEGFGLHHEDGMDFMPGAFFQHIGMTPSDSHSRSTLYYVSFDENTEPPSYNEAQLNLKVKPEVRIDVIDCRNCYIGSSNRRVVEAVLEQANKPNIELVIHEDDVPQTSNDKGMSNGVFIDGKLTFFRGPISEDDVWDAIEVAINAREQKTDR